MVNDVFGSIAKWFKERTTSPFYGTFILSEILWNWKFFYILFWQSEDKLLIPRIEYVQKYILDSQNIYDHLLYFLVAPAISTFIAIWWLPILSNGAHKKYINFYYKRKLIADKERLDYEKQENKNLDLLSDIKKHKTEIKKEIEKNSSEQERWKSEFYEKIVNSLENIAALKNIIEVVYQTNGKFKTRIDAFMSGYSYLDPRYFSRLDVLGLIDVQENTIKLTEKGKYFVLLLQDENKF